MYFHFLLFKTDTQCIFYILPLFKNLKIKQKLPDVYKAIQTQTPYFEDPLEFRLKKII
jgi:hypothetical protein